MRTPSPRSAVSRRGAASDATASSHAPPVERRKTARPQDGQPGGRVRARMQLRLWLGEGDGAAQAAEIREMLAGDLSSGGVFVHCQDPPQIGEFAHVEVCRPGGGLAFTALGRVAWRRASTDRLGRPPGFGLSFQRLDLRDAMVIRGMMDLMGRQKALTDGSPAEAGSLPALLLCSLDDVTTDVAALLQTDLPPEIQRFVQGYEQVSHRDAFLWRWAYQGVSLTTLSCVDPALGKEVRAIKLLSVMFAVLLDDAADRSIQGVAQGTARLRGAEEDPLLLALCQIPLGGAPAWALPPGVHEYHDFARRVYAEIVTRVSRLGRAPEFGALVGFDLQQLVQGVRHQHLLRQAAHFTSVTETRSFAQTGLPLLLAGAIDLCASPGFDPRETGLVREVLLLAQRMAHTAALLTGWEHQVETGNLGGAVVAHGLATGMIGVQEVDPISGPRHGARLLGKLRAGRVDSHFLTEWLRDRYQVRELAAHLRSVDMDQLLQAQQRLMWLQLSSRGLV